MKVPVDRASIGNRMLSRLHSSVWEGVTLLAALAAIASVQSTTRYTPDSFIYALMMLEDRHMTLEQATKVDRRFFKRQFENNPPFQSLIGADSPQYFRLEIPLFVNRPLYPFLSSLLFGRLGFGAMSFVSSIAYVLAALALFRVFVCFGPAPVAALVAIAAITIPTISYPSLLELGTYALTDMLALFFSVLALSAQIRYTNSGRTAWLALLLATALCLAATRPAIQFVDGGAVAVLVFGWVRRDRTYVRRGLAMSAIAFGVTIAYTIYLATIHAPGIAGQFIYLYERHIAIGSHKDVPKLTWYALQVVRTVVFEVHAIAMRPLAAATVLLGLYGLYAGRMKAEIVCVIGAMLSLSVALFTNPVPGDAGRPIEIPMIPILAVGIMFVITKRLSSSKQLGNGRLMSPVEPS
jgi:hypothetical protein